MVISVKRCIKLEENNMEPIKLMGNSNPRLYVDQGGKLRWVVLA